MVALGLSAGSELGPCFRRPYMLEFRAWEPCLPSTPSVVGCPMLDGWRNFSATATVKRMRHTYDRQDRILGLTFRQKSSQLFRLFPLRSEAVTSNPYDCSTEPGGARFHLGDSYSISLCRCLCLSLSLSSSLSSLSLSRSKRAGFAHGAAIEYGRSWRRVGRCRNGRCRTNWAHT